MAVKEVVFELKLFVDGKQVTDSTDFNLWQSVYKAIKRTEGKTEDTRIESALIGKELIADITDEAEETAVGDLAKMIGVDVPTLEGACEPRKEQPFIHLDMHSWANWTKNLPKRGPGSVSPITLAATLLALWFRISDLGKVTIKHSLKVLADIGAEDRHSTRSIKNCKWLQLRSGKAIQINASEIDKAIEVAKAFCEKRSPKLTSK